jgi:uncharacterized protein YkwD
MEESRVVLARRSTALLVSVFCAFASFAFTPASARPADGGSGDDATAHRSGSGFRFKRVERCFMRKINRRRAWRGLPRLRRDRQIGFVARHHAQKMARSRTVFHDSWLSTRITQWRALGQNSGRGQVCRTLFRAFWRSAHHRANILGDWRYFAVGARRRHGKLYVQQVFEFKSNPGNIWGLP